MERAPPAAATNKPNLLGAKKASPAVAVKKSNPFGAASAVDTASKLAKLDLKKKEWGKVDAKPEQKEPVKEEAAPVVAPTKEETPAPAAKESEKKPEPDAEKSEEKEKKRREPEKVNSRAAAMESSGPVSTSLFAKRITDFCRAFLTVQYSFLSN